MYYSAKKCGVKVNGEYILAESVACDENVNINPKYIDGQRFSNSFAPQQFTEGSFRIDYYLTGSDPIKNYFINESSVATVDVGGINIDQAYLRSYSLKISPNQTAKASAEFAFFNSLTGAFSPSTDRIEENPNNYLNYSDLTITQTNQSAETFTEFNSIDYSFNSQLTPVFKVKSDLGYRNFTPDRVVYGDKHISCSITSSNLNPLLTIYGEDCNAKINLKNKNGVTVETFFCSGKVSQKNISVQNKGFVQSTFNIDQYRVQEPPTITSFSPSSLTVSATTPSTTVTITGRNFYNITELYLGTTQIVNFTVVNDTTIQFVVDNSNDSGYITVKGFEGQSTSSSSLTINHTIFEVLSATPRNPRAKLASVMVEGQNFNNIDYVSIGQVQVTGFKVISDKLIELQIPSGISDERITVKSTARNISGTLGYDIFAPATITGFTPLSGIQGTSVTILGSNLSGIEKVYFNNYESHYFVNSTTGALIAIVPTGTSNVYGPISVAKQGGFTAYSPLSFLPDVRITGNYPISGVVNSSMRISGVNFYSNLLYPYPYDTSRYSVLIGGVVTGFYLSSSTLLTGVIPYSAKTGPIFIFKPDGASQYPSSGRYIKIPNAPEITYVSNTGLYSGDNLLLNIRGSNFQTATKFYLTGQNSGTASGKVIDLWAENYVLGGENQNYRKIRASGSKDVFGHQINLWNRLYYPYSVTNGNALLTGMAIKTGVYDLYAVNSAGTGTFTSGVSIYPLINIAQSRNTTGVLSSLETGNYLGITGYYGKFYGPNKVADGITGGNNANGDFCSTSGQTTPYLSMHFGGPVQLFEIQFFPRMDAQLFYDSGAFTQYLQIDLLYTGSVLQSGYATVSSGNYLITGYTPNYNYSGWRITPDQIKFTAHKLSAGVEQQTKFQASEIRVLGLYSSHGVSN